MEGKPAFAFIGDSHMAYWPLESYFPHWECRNYGVPGAGLDYVASFDEDVSLCNVIIEFGTNDLYRLTRGNIEEYVQSYVNAVRAIPSRQTYLFCLFPRNDYMDGSTAINRFIGSLNARIRQTVEAETDIVYLDVFHRLLSDGRLNPDMTVDDVHLSGAGYRVLVQTLREVFNSKIM